MTEGKPDAARQWPAPAKLNLFLHVTGRRDDGFHDIQTLFQFLDFADQLRFVPRQDSAIHRHGGLSDVPPAEDLVVRAASRLREFSGRDLPGVDIHLDKQIPDQAGLGGGSSDAATTLHALNQLWALNLDDQALADIGAELGADVPVFVHGRAVWAEGRGDRFHTTPELPEPWYLVINPACRVSTRALFEDPALARDCEPISFQAYLDQAPGNVFQPLVSARYPEVAEALRWLACYGDSRLTGTGASVFAAVDSEASGRQALSLLPDGWQGFLARGQNRSALRRLIEAG